MKEIQFEYSDENYFGMRDMKTRCPYREDIVFVGGFNCTERCKEFVSLLDDKVLCGWDGQTEQPEIDVYMPHDWDE